MFPMNRLPRLLGTACLSLVALGLLGGFPTTAQAAGIGFRNNLKIPVVVQGASRVNNVLRRGLPRTVLPGNAMWVWDTDLPPGDREIVVYDAQMPNRVLYRTVVRFQGQDMRLFINPAGPGGVTISDRPPP
jgi:hypothetical protein